MASSSTVIANTTPQFIFTDLATSPWNQPKAQRRFGELLLIAQRLAESDPANAAR